jgi:hypothetical protein
VTIFGLLLSGTKVLEVVFLKLRIEDGIWLLASGPIEIKLEVKVDTLSSQFLFEFTPMLNLLLSIMPSSSSWLLLNLKSKKPLVLRSIAIYEYTVTLAFALLVTMVWEKLVLEIIKNIKMSIFFKALVLKFG